MDKMGQYGMSAMVCYFVCVAPLRFTTVVYTYTHTKPFVRTSSLSTHTCFPAINPWLQYSTVSSTVQLMYCTVLYPTVRRKTSSMAYDSRLCDLMRAHFLKYECYCSLSVSLFVSHVLVFHIQQLGNISITPIFHGTPAPCGAGRTAKLCTGRQYRAVAMRGYVLHLLHFYILATCRKVAS